MERRPGKIIFEGLTIVRLPDVCTRQAKAFWQDGNIRAVHQRNGNIAVVGTGIFDNAHSPRAQFKTARCLYGLKLLSAEMLARYRQRYDDQETSNSLAALEFEAEVLGYRVVKKPRTKEPRVRKSRAK